MNLTSLFYPENYKTFPALQYVIEHKYQFPAEEVYVENISTGKTSNWIRVKVPDDLDYFEKTDDSIEKEVITSDLKRFINGISWNNYFVFQNNHGIYKFWDFEEEVPPKYQRQYHIGYEELKKHREKTEFGCHDFEAVKWEDNWD